jgi:peptide/nickel transport system ATP-binding protein
MAERTLLEVQDLQVKFYTYAGVVEALDGVNLFIKEGEILGLVGETGCGKSVTSLSIMMLVPPPGKIEGGRIILSGASKQQNVLTWDKESITQMRGKDIAMIFQEPRAYLNPVYSVENQIAEILLVHRKDELLKNSIASLQKLKGKQKPPLEERIASLEKQKGTEKQRAKLEKLLEKRKQEFHKRMARLEKQRVNIEKRNVELEKRKAIEKRKAELERQRVQLEKQKGTERQRAKLDKQRAKLEKRSAKQRRWFDRRIAKIDNKKADLEEWFNGVPSNYEVKVYKRMLRARSRTARLATRVYSGFIRKRQFKSETRQEVVRLLRSVEISDPERVARMYPHELSGGMAQRVVIAMALACNPRMLIADEPTTNLDVTVQAQILNLIKTLKKNIGSSILYITHDLGVVAQLCDRVAVMYAGNVIETADVFEVFSDPLHPYTRGLLESIPRPGEPFKSIPGIVPSLINPLHGCRFHDRCSYAMEVCRDLKPAFTEVKKGHYVSCHLYEGSK